MKVIFWCSSNRHPVNCVYSHDTVGEVAMMVFYSQCRCTTSSDDNDDDDDDDEGDDDDGKDPSEHGTLNHSVSHTCSITDCCV